eukprot:Clim_evm55s148 gene=Clim_evmTU55s148
MSVHQLSQLFKNQLEVSNLDNRSCNRDSNIFMTYKKSTTSQQSSKLSPQDKENMASKSGEALSQREQRSAVDSVEQTRNQPQPILQHQIDGVYNPNGNIKMAADDYDSELEYVMNQQLNLDAGPCIAPSQGMSYIS